MRAFSSSPRSGTSLTDGSPGCPHRVAQLKLCHVPMQFVSLTPQGVSRRRGYDRQDDRDDAVATEPESRNRAAETNVARSSGHRHGSAQHGACELLCRHRLCEQKALCQIKTHLTHREKVRSGLHALRDGAYAIAIGEIDNPTARRLFQPVM